MSIAEFKNGAGTFRSPATPLSARAIFVRYIAFAVIAGTLNLSTQAVAEWVLPQLPMVLAVLAGTGVGFATKYILDKIWIFEDPVRAANTELRKITLYGLSGVGTTLFFWGVEFSAWHLLQTTEAKYIGGALGLAGGNWIKYRLDKRFAFGSRQ
jgi:putative flippase GtrA